MLWHCKPSCPPNNHPWDIWVFHPAHAATTDNERYTFSRMAGVHAPLLEGEEREGYGVGSVIPLIEIGGPQKTRPSKLNLYPLPTANQQNSGDYRNLGSDTGDAGVGCLRETTQRFPGDTDIRVYAFLTTDDWGAENGGARVLRFNPETGEFFQRAPTDGVVAPTSEFGDGLDSYPIRGAMICVSCGTDHICYSEPAAQSIDSDLYGVDYIYWVDYQRDGVEKDWIQWASSKRYKSYPALAQGAEEDRHWFLAGCLNDFPRVITYNYFTGEFRRLNWTEGNTIQHTADTTPGGTVLSGFARFDDDDPQFERSLFNLNDTNFNEVQQPDEAVRNQVIATSYHRRYGEEVFLLGTDETLTNAGLLRNNATHYYNSMAECGRGALVQVLQEDLDAGRRPCAVHLGPNLEVFYGSSSFLRRLPDANDPDGWLIEAEWTESSLYRSRDFFITSNCNGLIVRGAHFPLRWATGLTEPIEDNALRQLGGWHGGGSYNPEFGYWSGDSTYADSPGQRFVGDRATSQFFAGSQTNDPYVWLVANWNISLDGQTLSPHRKLLVQEALPATSPFFTNTGGGVKDGIQADIPIGAPVVGPNTYEFFATYDAGSPEPDPSPSSVSAFDNSKNLTASSVEGFCAIASNYFPEG